MIHPDIIKTLYRNLEVQRGLRDGLTAALEAVPLVRDYEGRYDYAAARALVRAAWDGVDAEYCPLRLPLPKERPLTYEMRLARLLIETGPRPEAA